MQLSLCKDLGFFSLFYPVHICTTLWDSLLGFVHSGLACLAIGYPITGAHPSMSIVRLIMIGYHCNCMGELFNYQTSAHWLIGGATMYQLCSW